jgi:hypothetical protein
MRNWMRREEAGVVPLHGLQPDGRFYSLEMEEVERVIATRTRFGPLTGLDRMAKGRQAADDEDRDEDKAHTEYLVKWSGLPYRSLPLPGPRLIPCVSGSTWECEDVLDEEHEDVQRFRRFDALPNLYPLLRSFHLVAFAGTRFAYAATLTPPSGP